MTSPALAADFAQAYGYRAVGTTDEVVECQLCGKQNLRCTVIIEFLDENGAHDGEAYLGSDCAARKIAGRADRKLGARITREAQAADLRRAGAVQLSLQHLAYYEPFLAQGMPAFVREYCRLNAGASYPHAAASLARHREVIATGGRAAL